MPVFFTGLKPDHIARLDFLDRAVPTLRATAASGDIRGCPAWLSVKPTTSTVSASLAMRSRTRTASGVAGSEISAEVRAAVSIPAGYRACASHPGRAALTGKDVKEGPAVQTGSHPLLARSERGAGCRCCSESGRLGPQQRSCSSIEGVTSADSRPSFSLMHSLEGTAHG